MVAMGRMLHALFWPTYLGSTALFPNNMEFSPCEPCLLLIV